MSSGRDDDALSWDGDDDPTLDVGAKADASAVGRGRDAATPADPATAAEPATAVLPEGYTAVGKGSESLSAVDGDRRDGSEEHDDVAETGTDAEPRGLGNAALVGIGIFAGVYLLLALGWLLGTARLQLVAQLFLEPIAFQITLWLAVLALPLWFASVLWLTRGKPSWLRFTLLGAGAVLLIPWPFVLAGAFL